MSSNSRFIPPFFTPVDATGVPIPGAQLFFYLSGTDTPADSWSNAGLTVANTNPVVADDAGMFGNIFLDPTVTYKAVLCGPAPLTEEIWTADPLNSAWGTAENYQDLRSNGSPSVMVFVEGRLTEQDGGQGWFSLDPNDTTSSDNGGTILRNGTKRWKRLYNGPVFPEWWGAGKSPIDSTSAIDAAIAIGGQVCFQAYQYDYTALSITNPVRLTGANQSQDLPRTVLNCTAGGSGSQVVIGGIGSELDGVYIEHLNFTSPDSAGGTVLDYYWCANCTILDVQMFDLGQTSIGINGTQLNTMRFRDMRIINPVNAGIRFYGTDTTRSDDIELIGIIISGDSTGARNFLPTALQLEGFVNTISGHHLNFVTVGRGLWCVNAGGNTQRGEFVMMYDLEVDFPLDEAVLIEWHDGCYFTDCYFHGSLGTTNVVINNNASPTNTNYSFQGGNCTGAFQHGFLLNGRYTRISNVLIAGNNGGGGGHNGVHIGPTAFGALVQNCFIGEEAGLIGPTQEYGVYIEDGAQQYSVVNNDLRGNMTGPLHDASASFPTDSSCATLPNLGQIGTQSFVVNDPASGDTITFDRFQSLTIVGAGGVLATLEVALQENPAQGQEARVWSTRAVTALTLTPLGSGWTVDVDSDVTSMAAKSGFTLKADLPTKEWYRVA